MTSARKTIDDLPKYRVSALKQAETQKVERVDFELSGTFNRLDGVTEGTSWLLLPDTDILIALTGDLAFLDLNERTALYRTSDESAPDVVGSNLTYLGARWEPHHVWMVVAPGWTWSRVLFQAVDVMSRIVRKDEMSIVDGQEVREWIEIKKPGGKTGLSRYYPVFPDGRITLPPAEPDGVIRGGWDHEHCELCAAHIDTGNYGYIDLSGHWICEVCHGKYVVNHDLSFIDS